MTQILSAIPLRRKWLLLTQSTSHLFYGKLLKYIVEIKLVARGGKHENNECHTRVGERDLQIGVLLLVDCGHDEKSGEPPVSVKHREKEKTDLSIQKVHMRTLG